MKSSHSLLFVLIFIPFFACNTSKKIGDRYPDCSSLDIEKSDTCLLGLTLLQAMDKLKLDTSQVYTMQEPFAVIRGISFMPDSNSRVELFVERTPIKSQLDSMKLGNNNKIASKYLYQLVMNKKIIVVRWEKEMGARSKTVRKND